MFRVRKKKLSPDTAGVEIKNPEVQYRWKNCNSFLVGTPTRAPSARAAAAQKTKEEKEEKAKKVQEAVEKNENENGRKEGRQRQRLSIILCPTMRISLC